MRKRDNRIYMMTQPQRKKIDDDAFFERPEEKAPKKGHFQRFLTFLCLCFIKNYSSYVLLLLFCFESAH